MINYQTITIDLQPDYREPVVQMYLSESDVGRPIQVNVLMQGQPYSFIAGTTVHIDLRKPSGHVVQVNGNYAVGSNVVLFNVVKQMAAESGVCLTELSIVGDGQDPIGSKNWLTKVELSPMHAGDPSETWIEDLDELVQDAMEGHIDATLSIPGDAADAAAVGEELADLKSAIDHVAESVFYISVGPEDGYVPFCVSTGDSITVKTASGEAFAGTTNVGFYDASKVAIASLNVAPSHGKERTLSVTLSTPASYVKLTPSTGYAGEELIIINNSNETYQTIKDQDAKAEKAISYALYETVDRSADFTTGGYIPLNGGVGNTVNIDTPTTSVQRAYVVIPCHAGDSFVLTATGGSAPRAWGFTDVNAVLLSVAGSGANASDLLLTATADGYFISNHDITKTYALTATQLFMAVSESTVRDIVDDVVNVPPVVVDASGDGDYTSFTLACKENYNNDRDIVVKPGTYDIVSEYVAIWGQEAVDSMADADAATFGGWQYGVKLSNRKITFESGAHLVCDWTGHTVDGTHRFSALRVETNVELVGLDLDCTGTFYAIHDDYGDNSAPYTVTYENCRVIGHSLYNANCIGGGCKKHSRHILKNCYFDNNLTGSATVRYHNTNVEGAEPEIYVSNCYFNNWFTPRWYGNQTSKMRVYVNNCEARSIHKAAESSSYNADNVELYKWCNTETNPVT